MGHWDLKTGLLVVCANRLALNELMVINKFWFIIAKGTSIFNYTRHNSAENVAC